jgi:hypothetical protein
MSEFYLVEKTTEPRNHFRLVDGPHATRAGVEQASFILKAIGVQKRKTVYLCAEVTPVEAKPHDVDFEALAQCARMVT